MREGSLFKFNSVFVGIMESLPKSAERNRDRNARDETGTHMAAM